MPSPDVWTAPGHDLFAGRTDTVDGWYRFTEGPTRDPKGGVYFSDLVKKKIFHWRPGQGVRTVREGEATNGLAGGPDGALYGREPYDRRVVRIGADGSSTPIAERFDGKRFNSCHDLWVDAEGGVYFTDPMYSKDRAREQDGEHVYYVPPGGAPVRVIDDLVRPNGIVGTTDGKTLYVVDDGVQKTYRYSIEGPGELAGKALFAAAGADGITLDEAGRVYMVHDQVLVLSPAGEKVATLDMPFHPTNVTFGGPQRDLLVVTGKWVVSLVPTNVKGDVR